MARDEQRRYRGGISNRRLSQEFARVHMEGTYTFVSTREDGFARVHDGINSSLEGVDRHTRLADLY